LPARKNVTPCTSHFSISVFAMLLLAGCGAPGQPQARRPPIPAGVTDLSAQQLGDGVVLSFSLPTETIDRRPLSRAPAVEVLRAVAPEGGTPKQSEARLVFTIPSALVSGYVAEGRFQCTDSITPEQVRAHPDAQYLYSVRTRVSEKRASADSNLVLLRLYPVPERISSITARVTEPAIELSWGAVNRTTGGAALSAPPSYRVYRGEINPSSAAAAAQDISRAEFTAPLTFLGATASPSYRDTQFEFGPTYLYSVRTEIPAGTGEVESADSTPAVVAPRDVFPPAAPQGLEVIFVPATSTVPAHAELSWGISPETDLAGYHVYRSEQEGTRGALLTPELLLAPAFRDMSVVLGHRYFYRVTAVDRSGNESDASAPADLSPQQDP
jgi:hypothetical protein